VWKRLVQAIRSVSAVEAILQWTVDYTASRRAFGQTLADFQNTQFTLAELAAEAAGLRTFVDSSMAAFMDGPLSGVDAAKVKLVEANLHCKAADQCLQFFGGNGYVLDYPIARAYVDARVSKIAGVPEAAQGVVGRGPAGTGQWHREIQCKVEKQSISQISPLLAKILERWASGPIPATSDSRRANEWMTKHGREG